MLAVLIRSEDGEEIRVEGKEKELKDGFYPQCYEIHLDISTVNVNNLIEELSKISNMIFDGLIPVVYLRWGYFKKDLTDLLSKKITNEFFCEEVKLESCVGQSDLVSVFFKENYENAFVEYINQEKQKELLNQLHELFCMFWDLIFHTARMRISQP